MTVGLQIRGGSKVYPGTRALKSVDFDLHMGAVNVLVGENGAGKSTMMKVIAGVEQLTEGRILMDGAEVRFSGPDDARRHGIGIVFQELNLFPNLTVAENIFMGREKTRAGVDIDMNAQRAQTRALMARLEQPIDPDTMLGDLRVGQQQIVEIAKSLAQDARILILDEPTSALSAAEVTILFRVIDDLRRQGVGIVYISHRLEELLRIGDHITVLRDGAITGARPMEGVDLGWIVRSMIGEASKDYAKAEGHPFGPEIFRAEDVCLPRPGGLAVDHVSLSLRGGEILGVYGLMGAGRSEFLECVIGRHSHATGRLFIEGRPLTARGVAARIRNGIALIPEDRKNDGLVQILSIRENMTLSSLGAVTTAGVHMNLTAERRSVTAFVKRLTVKIASMENPVSSLSGGNQQKVVIGKALMTKPRVLLMDEPSRGIDIGAKAEVFRVMRDLAAQGLGIIFVTSDLEELMALSDRIIVMSNGRVTGRFDRKDATETLVVAASAKGHAPTPAQEPAA
ncbi:MAG: sugar ABC transporter ATP-binding protein [Paracoccus sp. (in: a-proteobacteria)]|uniref:sugar ABC transporter ATP-binding protein n=1 Tax=Paracoccus sp. TaxID=267 RepID=UPI00391BE4F0